MEKKFRYLTFKIIVCKTNSFSRNISRIVVSIFADANTINVVMCESSIG